MKRLFALLLWLFSACLCWGAASSPATRPLLLIIAGQSNAVGFGTTGLDVPAYLQAPMANALYWRNISTGAPVYGWVNYQCGQNSVPNTSPTPAPQFWGPEAQFAYEWCLTNPGQKIYMVKSAVSGSQLESTSIIIAPGAPNIGWCPTDAGGDFPQTVTTVQAAQAGLTALGVSSYDTAVLWMQGESDGGDPTCAAAYYTNLTNFVQQVRVQWLLGSSVPFVIGRIREVSWPYGYEVRLAECRVAVEQPFCTVVDTDPYPLYTDLKHYIAEGQVDLGHYMYASYINQLAPAGALVRSGGKVMQAQPVYGQTAVTMPATAAFTFQEQPANGTIIGYVAASNPQAYIPPTYGLEAGSQAGIGWVDTNGQLNVTDGTQLVFANGATRTVTMQAANGVNEPATVVTLNLTQAPPVTDVANTRFRADPNNASFYTLASGHYSVLTDTELSGFTLTAATAARPTQTAYGDGFSSTYVSTSSQVMNTAAANTYFCAPTDQNYTIMAACNPSSSGTGTGGIIACVYLSTSPVRLSIFYNYTAQTFGYSAALQSTGAIVSGNTTQTFPPNAWYTVRVQHAGSTCTLFVNGTSYPVTGFGGNTIRPTVMNTGETGSLSVGGNGQFVGVFTGQIGLVRFIDGSPTGPEVTFMNTEFNNWIAGP